MFDVLADVLATVRLHSTVYCQSEIGTSDWGLTFVEQPDATFHIIKQGECLLVIEGQTTAVCLQAGDLVVLPNGSAHHIRNKPEAVIVETIDLGDYVGKGCMLLRYGESPPATTLICGTFNAEGRHLLSFSALLPPLLHFSGAKNRASGLQTTLESLMAEANAQRPGSQAVLTRLADVLFVQVLRAWLEDSEHNSVGWLGALRDPYIARALSAIHNAPSETWSVGDMARAAAMSRSAFAARFSTLVGQPPLGYVRRWRMTLARSLLAERKLSMLAIAHQVGYGSEAAFSKAFKEETGMTPGAYRAQAAPERA